MTGRADSATDETMTVLNIDWLNELDRQRHAKMHRFAGYAGGAFGVATALALISLLVDPFLGGLLQRLYVGLVAVILAATTVSLGAVQYYRWRTVDPPVIRHAIEVDECRNDVPEADA